MKKTIVTLTIFASIFAAKAQISNNTIPYGVEYSQILPQVKYEEMPRVDTELLMSQDAQMEKTFDNRFAYAHEVNYTLSNSGEWTNLNNGDRIWRLGITSPGAFSLNTIFNHFELPEGASVHIYSFDGKNSIGGFTHENNKENHVLATIPVPGDRIVIEYYEPMQVKDEGILEIERIGHDYKNIFNIVQERGFNTSGSCNNNVSCPEADPWQDQVNSVAMSLIGGTRWCSGAMVANTNNDDTPYYLTADHCINGQNPSTWVFVFNYKSTTCSPATDGALTQSISNSTLRANRQDTDFALLELSAVPPAGYNVFYSGWDKSDNVPTNQVGIHHPDGDVMKISFDDDPATKQSFQGTTAWEVAAWDDGTTEGGSSGSPLYDQNKRIIGQLYGGFASCSSITQDYYGRFGISWNGTTAATRLNDWLDPNSGSGDTQNGYYLNSIGIDEVTSEMNQLEVYPNPGDGIMTVKGKDIRQIAIYDVFGKLVVIDNNFNGQLDVSKLSKGLYVLKAPNHQPIKIQVK